MAAFKKLGKGFRVSGKGGGDHQSVVVGLMANIKDEKAIEAALTGPYKKQINTAIEGSINTALDGVKAITAGGVYRVPANRSAAAIRSNIGKRPGFKRVEIELKLNPHWAPLTKPYLARKAKEKSHAKLEFWSNTGNLGRAVAAVPDVKATSKVAFRKENKTFGKGSNKYEYEVSTRLTNLPAPLQDLIRRPFMQAMAGEESSVTEVSKAESKFAPLAILETSGSNKAKSNKRPFIAQLSRELGERARKRVSNFDPYKRT